MVFFFFFLQKESGPFHRRFIGGSLFVMKWLCGHSEGYSWRTTFYNRDFNCNQQDKAFQSNIQHFSFRLSLSDASKTLLHDRNWPTQSVSYASSADNIACFLKWWMKNPPKASRAKSIFATRNLFKTTFLLQGLTLLLARE